MKIYRPDGKLWREVVALDSSFCEETLERFNRISLDFVLAEEVLIPELCYVTWRGERYSLFSTPKVVKVSTREYRYTLNLEGRHLELDRVLVKDKLGRTKFVFTGRTDQYAELISDCLPSWKVGACTTGDATRVIAFNNTSLLEACRMVASKFETEVQLTDGAISFGRVERYKSDPLLLAYRNGLKKDITMEPDPKETAIGRLYVVGGDRNIDPAKYGGHQLHLPKGGKVSVGGRSFTADAEGRYISLEGDTRLNTSERAFDATSIYPKRVGTVSKVEQVGEEWDVLDDANTIDYGQHRVGGDTMRLEFQSGRLAGRTFDLATKEDKLVGYVHSEKRFKLVRKEIDGVLMPEPTTFYPAVGDKYAIFGCSLPDEYITSAEGEMLLRGAEYMAERLEPRLQYRAELDGLWAKKNWGTVAHKLVVGTIVRLEGASSEVRISSVRTSLNSPYTPRITFSNAPYMVGSLATQIATLENAEVRQREELRAGLVKLQDRTYKDTEAVREMVEKLKVEGFSQALKPETLQTMYAVIGSPALQFEFVGRGFSWNEGKGGAVTIPRQTIRQRVAGTTLEPNPKTVETTIPALTYSLKPDEQQAHIYVELKPTPRYVVSTKPLQITPDRLLVGLLNGAEGSRDFTPLYGFTEISPSHIATRYIRSRSGNMLIDLETGNIYSDKIEFRRPDGSTKSVEEVITDTVQVGGRNLVLRSQQQRRLSAGYAYYMLSEYLTKDTDYTIQFDVEVLTPPEDNRFMVYFAYSTHLFTRIYIPFESGKTHYSATLKTPNKDGAIVDNLKSVYIYPHGWGNGGDTVSDVAFSNVKLERGTVATDWTPAPEDVQAEIEAVERGYQKLIERVDVEFAISNSRDTAPTSGWQTNAPTPARGQALWQRTKVYLKDGTEEVRGVTCIQGKDGLDGKDGAKGGDGADGRGITKIVELYYLSSSNTALGNGAWSETAPTPKEGFWIWTKTRIHYTTGEQIDTQPICVTGNKGDKGDRGERGLQGLQGKDGTDGLPGRDGVDGKTSYTHIAYADTASGGGFSQSPAGKAYIGMYVDFVQTDSTNPKKYAWSLIKGADGKNGLNGKDGVPGKPGADGRTPYLHIAYANSQDGTQGFSVSVSEGKSYIGTYTDYTQADSTDPAKYSWSKIKGDKGENGKNGSDGQSLYFTISIPNAEVRNGCVTDLWWCYLAIYNNGKEIEDYEMVQVYESIQNGPFTVTQVWDDSDRSIELDLVDEGYSQGLLLSIKIEYKGLTATNSIYIPNVNDGKDVDPKLLNEIQTGLSSATTAVETLQKAQQALDDGLLDRAKTADIQYLLDSLKRGSMTWSGGLFLINDIILSDPNSKDVTAMISGSRTEGAKAMRLGITYTCDPDKKTTVSGANAKWGVNLYAEVQAIEDPDDSKRIAKINELGFAIVGGRNLDWPRWEVCKRADLKDAGEATAFNNSGTGHIGELFFNGNYIGFGTEQQRYMTIGGVARTEQEMNEASTTIKEFEIPSGYVDDRNSSVVLERWESAERNRQLIFKVPITASCRCELIPSERQDGGSTNPSAPSQGSDTVYESNSVSVSVWAELEMRRGGRLIKTYKTTEVKASASVQGGSFPKGGPAFMSRNDSKSATQTISVPPEEVQKGDEWTLLLKCYGSGRRYAYYNGRTSGGTSLIPYDNSQPLISITDSKAAFFYGRQKQVLLNYASEVLKVIGNAIFQGNLNVKGSITADSYQGNGMPLAGATFNSSGGEVRALGRYKNRSSGSTASAYYDYSYKTYTVYHSIPHDKYIPLVTPFGTNGNNGFWNLSVRVYEVKAYSFTMALLTNQDNPTQNGFSYVAFQAE